MDNWSTSNFPPEGHTDVGRFAWDLYIQSEAEKERLFLKDIWMGNHRIWRGGSVNYGIRSFKKKKRVAANLIFSNVNRTVANLTAKNPSAEVIALDGGSSPEDNTDVVVTNHMMAVWNESEQNKALVDSCLDMEIYGTTIEKYVYNLRKRCGETVVVDPFAFVVAPGNWETPNDAPYVGMVTASRTEAIEKTYGLEPGSVSADDAYSALGEEREDNRPVPLGSYRGPASSTGLYGSTGGSYQRSNRRGCVGRALVLELFVRDMTLVETDELDPLGNRVQQLKYPGGIRVITVTNEGETVLSDVPNPNVNPEFPRELQKSTYLYDHFPYSTATSYRDPSSPWGFAAAEQVGDLAEKIAELLSRMFAYLTRLMLPPLVLPQDTGIELDQVNNAPGLILQPITGASGQGIHYIQVPSLPADFPRLYETMMAMFDRVYQIEDADRGEAPNRIIAASAIAALQERNAVLIRHKIRQIDYMIRQRGRAQLSFFQNFGATQEEVKVGDETTLLRGTDLIGRKFKYVVESGSTVTQTTLQIKEQALDLFKLKAIDSQDLLEKLNWPGWREVISRMQAGGNVPIDVAAQAFLNAGVPQEYVEQLLTIVQQIQQQQQKQQSASGAPPQQQQQEVAHA